jgi:hypothetical protein
VNSHTKRPAEPIKEGLAFILLGGALLIAS